MRREATDTAGLHKHASRMLAQIAYASFALAIVLAAIACWRATRADFRWLAPIAAAALNVALVAAGAWRDTARGGRAGAHSGPLLKRKAERETGWRAVGGIALAGLLRGTWWRTVGGFALARLRAIRWWPWCVLAGATLSLLLCAATWFVFGKRALAADPLASRVAALACVATLVLAFVTLVGERFFVARATDNHAFGVLAGALRVALGTMLAGAACAALDAWARMDARWLAFAAALLPAAIACEWILRVAASWFMPPRALAARTWFVDSAIAQLLVRPPLSPAEISASLRARFGIDLRQSWVIHSTLRMLPLWCVAVVALAWLLSGVAILQPDQRAVSERFGAPVAVWQPGLHVGLPWPFGRARVIDNGAVHQIVVSDVTTEARVAAAPLIAADARTPEHLDRLWDVAHAWETSQVIAGGDAQHQNFEVVSADVRLDYRIGPGDSAARAALYRASDVATTVRAIANREVVRYLASHTLDALVEARQTVIAEQLRRTVQQQIDALGLGIDVVAVVIESVHPPAGASAAWHGVQAAQIRAAASVAQARGLAAGLIGEAQQTALSTVDTAKGGAAETLSAARVQQTTFAADVSAAQAGGHAFAFEYYLRNLTKGLQNANLTVIDDRLVTGNRATIDLRSYNAGDAAGAKRLY
ncbi:protease modulator HflK [Paraburkholderia sacchari]|uniref:protease modulator HflK n=1 Tax=Paraburkholderia sacchari TaxID=159450 RepID=UPI003D982D11